MLSSELTLASEAETASLSKSTAASDSSTSRVFNNGRLLVFYSSKHHTSSSMHYAKFIDMENNGLAYSTLTLETANFLD